MANPSAFREVRREYDRELAEANRRLISRRGEVHALAPRVREIEEEIAALGAKVALAAASGQDAVPLVEDMRIRVEALRRERDAALEGAGFPIDYLFSVYKCQICKDTGYVDGKVCPCMRQRLIDKRYGLSNVRDIVKRENFSTFNFDYYSAEVDAKAGVSPRSAIERAYRLSKEFLENGGNLLFYGEPGLGKTFLCNCIAKEALDRGDSVLYMTAPQLFRELENLRFHREEFEEPEEIMAVLHSVDLLIIDDLGAEVSTVVTSSELFALINQRILDGKNMVVSTNLAPADFETIYSERIISRLVGHFLMVKFVGEDIRVAKKYLNR